MSVQCYMVNHRHTHLKLYMDYMNVVKVVTLTHFLSTETVSKLRLMVWMNEDCRMEISGMEVITQSNIHV